MANLEPFNSSADSAEQERQLARIIASENMGSGTTTDMVNFCVT